MFYIDMFAQLISTSRKKSISLNYNLRFFFLNLFLCLITIGQASIVTLEVYHFSKAIEYVNAEAVMVLFTLTVDK